MSWSTINFFKYDPDEDGSKTFNIKSALNDNWDEAQALTEELRTASDTKEIKATFTTSTMTASGWSSSEYSFEGTYPVTTYDIEIQPNGDSITDAQMKAWNKAKVYGSASANKAIAKGTVPTIDIPIIIKAVEKNAQCKK